jgi:hypothetical protein
VSALTASGACVRDRRSALAMPKSVTIAVRPESSTVSGLMSRCTSPRPCAYSSATPVGHYYLAFRFVVRK